MKYSILAAATAAAFALAPMSASAVTATISGTVTAVPPEGTGANENDFISDMETLLGTSTLGLLTFGEIALDSDGGLRFTELASESGFQNTFTAGGTTMTEAPLNNIPWGGGDETITLDGLSAGGVTGLEFDGDGVFAPSGSEGFAIFFDATGQSLTEGAAFSLSGLKNFILAYDDQGKDPDDNHDDYVIGVQVVPVPLGALLIGTAFLGAGAVRRFGGRKAA